MILKKIISSFFFFFFIYSFSYSQWSISTNQRSIYLIKDFLENKKSADFEKGYNFFGPDWSPNENVIHKGIPLNLKSAVKKKHNNLNIKNKSIVFELIKFKIPFEISSNNYFLFINSFIAGYKDYILIIKDGKYVFKKHISVKQSGYQIPLEIRLSEFINSAGQPFIFHQNNIDEFLIVLSSENIDNSKFVLGELKLYNVDFSKAPAKGLFFEEVSGNSLNDQESYTLNKIGDSYPLIKYTFFRGLSSSNYYFSLIDSTNQKDRTINLIATIFKKYPYLEDRNIQRKDFLAKIYHVVNSTKPFEEKINEFKVIADNLNDGHFKIFTKYNHKKIRGPVIFKKIKGKTIVVGVFDHELKNLIPLGAIVKEIDGKNVQSFFPDSLLNKSSIFKKRNLKEINQLMYKNKNDSTKITFFYNGYEKFVTYKYDVRYQIPNNFKPIHGKFEIFNGWNYFKLNYWKKGDWIRFYNHKSNLEKSKGIIFDLRGNTGGREIEALRILSCFINEPIVSGNNSYTFNNNSTIFASNILKPNPYLKLVNLKVIILINHNTACTSELFIELLKKYKKSVIVIGDSKTAGSLANAYNFYLPFGIIIKNNIVNKFYISNKTNIEYYGIEPDIYIPIYNYKDLFPYNDKVLIEAIKLGTIIN